MQFWFHDAFGDTSMYRQINVYNGPALFQHLPRSQKDGFKFHALFQSNTYVFYFKLIDEKGRESRKSKNYVLFVN